MTFASNLGSICCKRLSRGGEARGGDGDRVRVVDVDRGATSVAMALTVAFSSDCATRCEYTRVGDMGASVGGVTADSSVCAGSAIDNGAGEAECVNDNIARPVAEVTGTASAASTASSDGLRTPSTPSALISNDAATLATRVASDSFLRPSLETERAGESV